MSLFTGFLAQGIGNSSAFVENTAGTARVPVTLSSIAGGVASLAGAAGFQNSSAATVTQRGLYDAASGGNLIMWWNLPAGISVSSGSPDLLAAGALNHTYPKLSSNGPGIGATPAEFAQGEQVATTSAGKPVYAGVALEASLGTIYAAAVPGAQYNGPGSSNVNAYRQISDAAGSLQATDGVIAYTALTATRAFALGAASGFPNMHFKLKDESGAAGTYAITITGTLDGATNKTLNTAYGVLRFYSNGTAWFTE